MRITQNITYNTYVNDILGRQESLYKTNNEISTGKKLNSVSDDPVNASEVITSKSILAGFDQYGKNMDAGLSYLGTAEGALSSVKNVITSIQEIAINQATGTADTTTRQAAARVAQGLFDQLVSLANTSYDGKYIFSGYKTSTQPFDSSGNYSGDANKYSVKLDYNTTVSLGVNGGEAFKGAGLPGGVDVFGTISGLVTALNNNDSAGIQSAIGGLETSYNQISNAVADIGAKSSRIMAAKDELASRTVDLKSTISNLEDADLTKVISDLQLGQVALQAAMTSAGKVFGVNIFNYL